MLEYVKVQKDTLVYIIIIGILFSLMQWFQGLYIGLTNTIFSIIFSIISFYIILFVFNFVANWYGLYVNFTTIYAEREIKGYDIVKKQTFSTKLHIDISYILTIIISLISFSFIVPIIFGIKPIVIESKRVGRSKNIQPTNTEMSRIVFLSFILLWIIFSIIKYLTILKFPIFYGFVKYFLDFLIFFTYFSLVPWNIILSGILSLTFNYSFKSISLGDRLFLSNTKSYIASLISLSLLPILSLIFNPLISIILIALIYAAVWIRLYSNEVLT